MKARHVVGLALAATGVAFALGFATAPVPQATAGGRVVVETVMPTLQATAVRPPSPAAGRRPLPTVRRFDPPPLPAEDPGVAAIVNGPDEPAADVVAARWEDIDRRLDELFGAEFPAAKRSAIRTAQATWIREHGRVVRAYYRGYIDQAELTDHIHANMLGQARAIEATLTRDEYRAFMDLEPGDDPFIVLVPPGVTVGQSLNDQRNAHGDDHDEDIATDKGEEYGNPDKKVAP